jgi:hypothetical protein
MRCLHNPTFFVVKIVSCDISCCATSRVVRQKLRLILFFLHTCRIV